MNHKMFDAFKIRNSIEKRGDCEIPKRRMIATVQSPIFGDRKRIHHMGHSKLFYSKFLNLFPNFEEICKLKTKKTQN